MKKYKRRSIYNTGPTLKVNSDDKTIYYKRLRDSQFQDHQA